jgi:signal-transduction protein with cAMP-binding, CBS, and nucleotidyltransferase domain
MGKKTLKELMVTDFLQVHLTDSMQDVYPQLTERPDRFVVVLDDEGVPLYLTTADEMRGKMPRSLDWPAVGDFAARLSEALLADEGATIDQAMVFFGAQPRGLAVMRDSEVMGVLPYETLVDHFNERIVPLVQAAGQTVRAGQPVTVASAVFRCRRYPRCSFEIAVTQINEPPLCGIQAAHGRTRLQA